MGIARTSVNLMGTTGAGQGVAAAATEAGAMVDALGDDVSSGRFKLRLRLVGTAAGSVDVRVNGGDPAGSQVYTANAFQHLAVATVNGTKFVELGWYSATRKVSVDVKNNDGANAVTVWVWAELEKYTP